MANSAEVKNKLLCSIFPEKLDFDGENYRTQKLNRAMESLALKYNKLWLYKNEKTDISVGLSSEASLIEYFSNTLLEDISKIYKLKYYILTY